MGMKQKKGEQFSRTHDGIPVGKDAVIDAGFFFALAPLSYHSLNEEGVIIAVNDSWEALFGRTSEEAVGCYFGDFLSPESAELFRQRFTQFLETREVRQAEFTIIQPDGTRLLVEVNGRVATDDQGNFIQTHCILSDITEQRRAAKALAESESRFKGLFESNIDGVVYMDMCGSLIEVNAAFCGMLHASRDELLGKNMFDIMPTESRETDLKVFHEQMCPSGSSQEYSREFVSPGGHRMKAVVRSWLNRDETGKAVGAWCIIRDVTQVLNTRAALERSEDRYRQVMRSTSEGLLGMDVDDRIVVTNPSTYDLLGYSQAELVGRPFFELVAPDEIKTLKERMNRSTDPEGERFELRLVRKDDTVISVLVSGAPILSPRGERTGYFAMLSDLTDQKRAEEALRLTQFSVDNAPVDIYWVNAAGRVIYANEHACESHGYTREEMLRLSVPDFNTDFTPEYWRDYWEVRKTTTVNRLQSIHTRKDGSTFPVDIVSHYQVQDGMEYLFVFSFDMTEIQRTSRELQRNQTLLNEVQLISQTGGWEIDVVTGDMIWTEGQYRLLGMNSSTKPRLALEYFNRFVHPEDRGALAKAMYDVLELKEPVETEYRALLPDGREAIFLTKGIPELGPQGEVMRVYGSTLDVTRERRIAEELKNAQNRLLNILDGIHATIYVSTMDTDEILFVNEHMRNQFGDESLLRPCYESFRGETARCEHCPKPRLLDEDGRPVQTIISEGFNPILNRWFLNHDRVIPWLEGEWVHMHMAADITDLKNMEVELKKATASAEAANVAKTEFLANMSHEIRTPLNGLLGVMQLLQLTELVEEQRNYLDTAIASGRNLLQILNDILDLSKIESGKLDFDEQDMELGDILDSVVSVFRHQAMSHGVDMRWKVDCSRPRHFRVDKGRLRQILFNLVGNSVKFTESGFVEVEAYPLQHISEDGKQRIFFSVTDTGIGIPDDKIGQVFDPFTQVDGSTTRKYQGTGLGLGIVRRLAFLMGGNASIISEEGKGTTVVFTIAAYPADRCELKGSVACFDTDRKGLSILVAEDEKVNRMVATRLLGKLGHETICVEDGEKASELLKQQRFDCLLTDIQMPVMDGVQLARTVREELRLDIPIIALTAHAMKGDRKRFLEAGMNGYLSKPFDLAELQQEIYRVILAASS